MLKKLSFVIAFVALSYSGFAQSEYKKFRVDVGLGYTIPKGGGGILFAVEPKYSVIPNKVSAGLRFESAAMARAIGNTEASFSGVVSYVLTGDYHFTQTTARPFAGLGFGLYNSAAASVSTSGTTAAAAAEKASGIGGLIRGGLDVAHMRFAVEYNMAPSANGTSYNSSGVTEKIKVKNSYIGIKFNVYIGGGKKD